MCLAKQRSIGLGAGTHAGASTTGGIQELLQVANFSNWLDFNQMSMFVSLFKGNPGPYSQA